MSMYTTLRNFTGVPSTEAGLYCHRRAAATTVASYSVTVGVRILASITCPCSPIVTSMAPFSAVLSAPVYGGNVWLITTGGTTSALLSVYISANLRPPADFGVTGATGGGDSAVAAGVLRGLKLTNASGTTRKSQRHPLGVSARSGSSR